MSMRPIKVGETLLTPGKTIGEGDIHLFAGLVGDFTPIHVDETFAKTTPHGTRIAHGPLGMATAIGMLTHTGILGERVLGLVNLNWTFGKPIMLGDTVRSRVTILELRPTSKPGRSLLALELDVINQRDESVQRGEMKVILLDDKSGE